MTRRNRRSREAGENATTTADPSRASGADHSPAPADDQVTIAEALQESERRYRSLFDHLPNGYAHCRMILDEHGRPVDFVYQSVNAAFERLTGLKDVVGKPVSETIPGLRESSPELFTSYARVVASGESETFEVELESLGMWFFISAYSTEPGYFDAVFQNITERKLAEEALAASEARYRIMGESVDYGVWASDADGRATYVSPSFCELVRKSLEEIRDFGWLDVLVPEQRDEVVRLWMHSVSTGEPFEHEHHFVSRTGEIRMVLARGNPARNGAGEIVSWAGINLDITERKHAEAEIHRLNDELEERVLTHTAQLAASNQENDALEGRMLTRTAQLAASNQENDALEGRMLTRTAQLEASNQENDELVNETVALVEDNAAITRLAATDVLTGLANRRHFHEALENSVSFARRHRSPLAVVSLDLDGLKVVNDAAGHEAGDEVLASFAALLAALCRTEDLPARLGGDEFSVLLPGIELGGALGLAERVLAAVRSCAILAERGVTASVGVAAWKADEIPNDLLKRADEALYAAKSCGGDSVTAHD